MSTRESNQPRLKIEFPVQDKSNKAWIGAGYTKEDGPPVSLTFRRVRRQREFRDKIDLRKGPCNRKVRTMIRKKAKDENGKLIEYLIYTEEWQGFDWLGNKMTRGADHQGEIYIPVMEKRYSINPKDGKEIEHTVPGSRYVYDIPVPSKETERKKLVDDIINKKYANVTNITEKGDVMYYFDFRGANKQLSYYDNEFNHEQFVNMTFDQAYEHSKNNKDAPRPGLPAVK